MISQKKVLFCVLDWGLGHATRVVPLIEAENIKGHEVFIASDGNAARFLKNRFPHLTHLDGLPGYNVTYSVKGRLLPLHIAKQIPRICRVVKDENAWLKMVNEEYHFDEIISDNRYGCSLPNVHSVFITHQLNIRAPFWLRPFVNWLIRKLASTFNEIRIPDYPKVDTRLAGELSDQGRWKNVRYIGPLSRFSLVETEGWRLSSPYLLVLSGPEPQRTILEELVIDLFTKKHLPLVVVAGKTDANEHRLKNGVEYFSHLNDSRMKSALLQAKLIICRSGYSSIMDLEALNKKALFIPTPGQTEQEYLAEIAINRGFFAMKQEELESQQNLKLWDHLLSANA